jgi:L-2,4-diaminobutyrate decarboxylase
MYPQAGARSGLARRPVAARGDYGAISSAPERHDDSRVAALHSILVHRFDETTDALATAVIAYARQRMLFDPPPLDAARSESELAAAVGPTVTPEGLGGEEALRRFVDELATACISTDHPRYLSFIPTAPTEASTLFDLVVSASCLYAGSWMEGSGAVHAENEALRWLAGLAGLPEGAGGVFVPGGSVGNLSALVAARHRARGLAGESDAPRRWLVAGSAHTHSSIVSAADVMDVGLLEVEVDAAGRLTGPAVAAALDAVDPRDAVFAVVATAGTTNFGIVDDLDSVGRVCAERGIWYHVDAAYGGAGLAAPSVRPLFAGIERADSFVVDPHKWLFAPFDCCALVYRDPEDGRLAHTQHAGYLDVLTSAKEMSPSDYAIGLTRRARGLPFWFSLAVHGTRAYADAVERTLAVARYAADEIRRRPYLELLREPDLSVVVHRRLGWEAADYHTWSARILKEGLAFVVPTTHEGETVSRFAIVNPLTTEADIATILDTMA